MRKHFNSREERDLHLCVSASRPNQSSNFRCQVTECGLHGPCPSVLSCGSTDITLHYLVYNSALSSYRQISTVSAILAYFSYGLSTLCLPSFSFCPCPHGSHLLPHYLCIPPLFPRINMCGHTHPLSPDLRTSTPESLWQWHASTYTLRERYLSWREILTARLVLN